ncbi:MAG: GNAT family N-acetyltransferase [Acidimicrobiales bacterium]|jgi:ribosomal protein S18 acetylase RimI-like enzyme|nr:GNAT family N-acetyltransferase [Acidimicrobiales bacterium]
MIRTKLDVVQWGTDRLRIGPWRGDPSIAYIAPATGRPPGREAVDHCLDLLRAQGFHHVLSSALTEAEQAPFHALGFTLHERLHLLCLDLRLAGLTDSAAAGDGADRAAPPRPVRLRRAWRGDLPRVLDIDGRAFDPFWRFDRAGIADARTATPASRFRVAVEHGVIGYAITGLAGSSAYLQRLAVDPSRQGRGVGSALVGDALWWARRRGAVDVLVNTQESNHRALELYESLGFHRQPSGLAVLELQLGSDARS